MMMKDFTRKGTPVLSCPMSGTRKRTIYDITLSVSLLLFLLSCFVYPSYALAPTVASIDMAETNQPPVAGTDVVTTDEDTPVSGNVLTNDHDPEGGALHVIAETLNTAHGQAVIHADGTFTYTPNLNFHGEDTFTYQVCDDASPNACCHGTVKITVVCIQDVPIGNPDAYTTPEDTKLEVTSNGVLKNDVDPDGEPITAILGKPTKHGTLVFNTNGTFTYMPDLNYNGMDTFTYYANDGKDNSAETLVTITVVPVNDPPIAVNDAIITNEDTPVKITVLSNDTDVDETLKGSMIIIVTQPVHGTVAVNKNNGKVTYTPSLNYYGNDSFTYKLKDSGGAFSNVATVTITVNPVNDMPIAAPDQVTTPEDVPVVISVSGNDTDVDNAIDASSAAVASSPSHGSVVVQPGGTFLYTPGKDFYGTDSFTYTIKDVAGATSKPGTVTIIVTPVNDPPVAMNDAATTDENTAVGIPVLANDFDVDNTLDPSSINIGTNPQHGTLSINTSTGVVTYTPAQDYVGSDSFSYTIKDPPGLVSNPATVSIEVIDVNLPPVAVDDAITHNSVSSVTIDVMANDYDPDNAHDELSIVSVTNPSKGTVSIVGDEIVYTPEGDLSTTVTFTYTITDPGGLTDEAVVTINYTVLELIVSQGFSPNGDGNNDTWYIKGIEGYPNNVVKVYDRWGLLVYQKAGYENTIAPWDGRANTGQLSGKLVDKGTYYYILQPGGGLNTLTGYVVIIR